MNDNRILIAVTAASLLLAAFCAGYAQQSRAEAEHLRGVLRATPIIQYEGEPARGGEWIEIRRGTTVLSEWQPADGEIYDWLGIALSDDE